MYLVRLCVGSVLDDVFECITYKCRGVSGCTVAAATIDALGKRRLTYILVP